MPITVGFGLAGKTFELDEKELKEVIVPIASHSTKSNNSLNTIPCSNVPKRSTVQAASNESHESHASGPAEAASNSSRSSSIIRVFVSTAENGLFEKLGGEIEVDRDDAQTANNNANINPYGVYGQNANQTGNASSNNGSVSTNDNCGDNAYNGNVNVPINGNTRTHSEIDAIIANHIKVAFSPIEDSVMGKFMGSPLDGPIGGDASMGSPLDGPIGGDLSGANSMDMWSPGSDNSNKFNSPQISSNVRVGDGNNLHNGNIDSGSPSYFESLARSAAKSSTRAGAVGSKANSINPGSGSGLAGSAATAYVAEQNALKRGRGSAFSSSSESEEKSISLEEDGNERFGNEEPITTGNWVDGNGHQTSGSGSAQNTQNSSDNASRHSTTSATRTPQRANNQPTSKSRKTSPQHVPGQRNRRTPERETIPLFGGVNTANTLPAIAEEGSCGNTQSNALPSNSSFATNFDSGLAGCFSSRPAGGHMEGGHSALMGSKNGCVTSRNNNEQNIWMTQLEGGRLPDAGLDDIIEKSEFNFDEGDDALLTTRDSRNDGMTNGYSSDNGNFDGYTSDSLGNTLSGDTNHNASTTDVINAAGTLATPHRADNIGNINRTSHRSLQHIRCLRIDTEKLKILVARKLLQEAEADAEADRARTFMETGEIQSAARSCLAESRVLPTWRFLDVHLLSNGGEGLDKGVREVVLGEKRREGGSRLMNGSTGSSTTGSSTMVSNPQNCQNNSTIGKNLSQIPPSPSGYFSPRLSKEPLKRSDSLFLQNSGLKKSDGKNKKKKYSPLFASPSLSPSSSPLDSEYDSLNGSFDEASSLSRLLSPSTRNMLANLDPDGTMVGSGLDSHLNPHFAVTVKPMPKVVFRRRPSVARDNTGDKPLLLDDKADNANSNSPALSPADSSDPPSPMKAQKAVWNPYINTWEKQDWNRFSFFGKGGVLIQQNDSPDLWETHVNHFSRRECNEDSGVFEAPDTARSQQTFQGEDGGWKAISSEGILSGDGRVGGKGVNGNGNVEYGTSLNKNDDNMKYGVVATNGIHTVQRQADALETARDVVSRVTGVTSLVPTGLLQRANASQGGSPMDVVTVNTAGGNDASNGSGNAGINAEGLQLGSPDSNLRSQLNSNTVTPAHFRHRDLEADYYCNTWGEGFLAYLDHNDFPVKRGFSLVSWLRRLSADQPRSAFEGRGTKAVKDLGTANFYAWLLRVQPGVGDGDTVSSSAESSSAAGVGGSGENGEELGDKGSNSNNGMVDSKGDAPYSSWESDFGITEQDCNFILNELRLSVTMESPHEYDGTVVNDLGFVDRANVDGNASGSSSSSTSLQIQGAPKGDGVNETQSNNTTQNSGCTEGSRLLDSSNISLLHYTCTSCPSKGFNLLPSFVRCVQTLVAYITDKVLMNFPRDFYNRSDYSTEKLLFSHRMQSQSRQSGGRQSVGGGPGGWDEISEFILSRLASELDLPLTRQMTPLMCAIYGKHHDLAEFLIRNCGVDVESTIEGQRCAGRKMGINGMRKIREGTNWNGKEKPAEYRRNYEYAERIGYARGPSHFVEMKGSGKWDKDVMSRVTEEGLIRMACAENDVENRHLGNTDGRDSDDHGDIYSTSEEVSGVADGEEALAIILPNRRKVENEWKYRTPLHLACRNSDLRMVKLLVNNVVDKETAAFRGGGNNVIDLTGDDTTGDDGIIDLTGKMTSAKSASPSSAMILSEGAAEPRETTTTSTGADPNLIDQNSTQTPLLIAIEAANVEVVEYLLNDPRVNVNEPFVNSAWKDWENGGFGGLETEQTLWGDITQATVGLNTRNEHAVSDSGNTNVNNNDRKGGGSSSSTAKNVNPNSISPNKNSKRRERDGWLSPVWYSYLLAFPEINDSCELTHQTRDRWGNLSWSDSHLKGNGAGSGTGKANGAIGARGTTVGEKATQALTYRTRQLQILVMLIEHPKVVLNRPGLTVLEGANKEPQVCTLLQAACANGNVDVVRALVLECKKRSRVALNLEARQLNEVQNGLTFEPHGAITKYSVPQNENVHSGGNGNQIYDQGSSGGSTASNANAISAGGSGAGKHVTGGGNHNVIVWGNNTNARNDWGNGDGYGNSCGNGDGNGNAWGPDGNGNGWDDGQNGQNGSNNWNDINQNESNNWNDNENGHGNNNWHGNGDDYTSDTPSSDYHSNEYHSGDHHSYYAATGGDAFNQFNQVEQSNPYDADNNWNNSGAASRHNTNPNGKSTTGQCGHSTGHNHSNTHANATSSDPTGYWSGDSSTRPLHFAAAALLRKCFATKKTTEQIIAAGPGLSEAMTRVEELEEAARGKGIGEQKASGSSRSWGGASGSSAGLHSGSGNGNPTGNPPTTPKKASANNRASPYSGGPFSSSPAPLSANLTFSNPKLLKEGDLLKDLRRAKEQLQRLKNQQGNRFEARNRARQAAADYRVIIRLLLADDAAAVGRIVGKEGAAGNVNGAGENANSPGRGNISANAKCKSSAGVTNDRKKKKIQEKDIDSDGFSFDEPSQGRDDRIFRRNDSNKNTKLGDQNANDREDDAFAHLDIGSRAILDVNIRGWSNLNGHEVSLLWQLVEEGEVRGFLQHTGVDNEESLILTKNTPDRRRRRYLPYYAHKNQSDPPQTELVEAIANTRKITPRIEIYGRLNRQSLATSRGFQRIEAALKGANLH